MAVRKKYWTKYISEMWHVRHNNETLSKHFTKAVAVDAGVKVAKANAPSSLYICKVDGTIESERTYENDPYPPRG